MSEKLSGNPLEPMRKAHEDEYFRRQNAELAAQLKARLEIQKAGIHDSALADQLAKAGFNEDSLRVLYLIPVLEVAWADGKVQQEERDEILKVAESRGIIDGSQAFKLINGWLAAKPSDETFMKAKSLVDLILEDLKTHEAATWILHASERVALATGGLFGMGSKISEDEKNLLTKLSQKLKPKRF